MAEVHPQSFYDQVSAELKEGRVIADVWSEAEKLCSQGSEKVQSLYIEMRVAQLERDTRKVRIVAQHWRYDYGLNPLMLWLGWLPGVGSVYLWTQRVNRLKVVLVFFISIFFGAVLVVLNQQLDSPAWQLFAGVVVAWAVTWCYLASMANRWIAEAIEPLKSILSSVDRRDVRDFINDEKIIVDLAAREPARVR